LSLGPGWSDTLVLRLQAGVLHQEAERGGDVQQLVPRLCHRLRAFGERYVVLAPHRGDDRGEGVVKVVPRLHVARMNLRHLGGARMVAVDLLEMELDVGHRPAERADHVVVIDVLGAAHISDRLQHLDLDGLPLLDPRHIVEDVVHDGRIAGGRLRARQARDGQKDDQRSAADHRVPLSS
jgi:hypothetical protein